MPRRDVRTKPAPTSTRKPVSTDSKNATASSPSAAGAATIPSEPPIKSTASNNPVGSGMFAQMAATAGGVAIGSALGRVLGGLFESSETKDDKTSAVKVEPMAVTSTNNSQQSNLAAVDDCTWEIKQFLTCVDGELDMKVCDGFKEAMQQCKLKKPTNMEPVIRTQP